MPVALPSLSLAELREVVMLSVTGGATGIITCVKAGDDGFLFCLVV